MGQRPLAPIYPVPIKPASKINGWGGWPDDVREVIRGWNKGKSLSFRRFSVFKCVDCEEFCAPHTHGAAVLNGDWLCDDCLIERARAGRRICR